MEVHDLKPLVTSKPITGMYIHTELRRYYTLKRKIFTILAEVRNINEDKTAWVSFPQEIRHKGK